MNATASASLPPSTATPTHNATPDYRKDIGDAFEGIAVLVAIAVLRGLFLVPPLYYQWRARHRRARRTAQPTARARGGGAGRPRMFDLEAQPQPERGSGRGQLTTWDTIVPISVRAIQSAVKPASRIAASLVHIRGAFARVLPVAHPAPASAPPPPPPMQVAVAIAMPAPAPAHMPAYAFGLAQLPVRAPAIPSAYDCAQPSTPAVVPTPTPMAPELGDSAPATLTSLALTPPGERGLPSSCAIAATLEASRPGDSTPSSAPMEPEDTRTLAPAAAVPEHPE